MKKVGTKIREDIARYGGGILIVLVVWILLSFAGRGFCPISGLFGLPCPGCGMTRSLLLLLTGKWRASIAMQPFAGIWLFFAAAVGVERYLLGKNGKWKLGILIVLLSSMLVYYCYKMITVFPTTEPYRYQEDNITEQLFPGYSTFIQQYFLTDS